MIYSKLAKLVSLRKYLLILILTMEDWIHYVPYDFFICLINQSVFDTHRLLVAEGCHLYITL